MFKKGSGKRGPDFLLQAWLGFYFGVFQPVSPTEITRNPPEINFSFPIPVLVQLLTISLKRCRPFLLEILNDGLIHISAFLLQVQLAIIH